MYKKLLFLFFVVVLFFGKAFSQTYHTITIDGTNDFTDSDEKFETTSGSDLYAYITWDADYIYVGLSGSTPSGTVTDNNRVYHIYIDTDPVGGNGTTDGETWRWDPTLPFNADYHYAFKTVDNSEYKRKFSNAKGWTDATITTSNYKGSGYWELSISRSDLGSPSEIKVLMYVEEDWDGGYISGGLPNDLFTNTTTQGAITFNNHYQGYTLDDNYTPNSDNSHDYIMRRNYYYLSFDGSNDYVKYTDDATLGKLDGATDYTLEAWIYPRDGVVAEYDRVFQRYYSFAIVMYDGNNDGKVEDWYFQVYDKGSSSWKYYNTEGDATLTLDAWNHIAVINNSTDGTLKLYVNGTDVTTTGGYSNRAMPSSSNNDNLYIGQKGNGSSYFGGYIDEVRMLNVAITPSELHTNWSDNRYMTNDNTAALFHFDEGSGTNTVNVPSGTDATLNNGVAWEEDDSAVPVELTSFTANVNGNNVLLNWQTATEVNNYGFEIQRSAFSDQRSEWNTIGFVKGNGTSNSPKEYSFTDIVSQSGKYSYRLKQIDIDGSYKYSDIVEVNIGTPEKFELSQNYPNPFNPSTTIEYSIPKNSVQNVQLKIYDVLGREVATLVNGKQEAGRYKVKFNANNLPSGIYFYTLRAGDFVATKKMILLK